MLSTPENDPCSVRNTLAEINIAIDRDGNLGDETSSLQPKNLLLAQPQTLGLSFAALKYNTSDLDAYVSCDVQPAEAKNPGSAGLFIPASSAISVLQALDEATVSFSSTSSPTSVESLPDCDGGVSHQPFSNFGMGTEDCRGLLISPQLSDALPSFSQDQSWNLAEGLVYTGAMPSPPFKSLTAGFSSVCSGSAFYASPSERPWNFPPLSFDKQFMPCSGITWTGQDLFVADHAIPDCTSYGSSQDSFTPLADEGLWFWQAPIPQPKSLVTADSCIACPIYGCKRNDLAKGFKRKDHLSQHLRVVHLKGPRDLVPEFCPHKDCQFSKASQARERVFSTSREYIRHLKLHHKESLFNCSDSECRRKGKLGYSGRANLLNHAKNKHPHSISQIMDYQDCLLKKLANRP